MMDTLFALALLLSTPAPSAHTDIVLGTVHTVRPTREAKLPGHTATAPFTRRLVVRSAGCTVRTLMGDGSGQTVTACPAKH